MSYTEYRKPRRPRPVLNVTGNGRSSPFDFDPVLQGLGNKAVDCALLIVAAAQSRKAVSDWSQMQLPLPDSVP